MASKDAGFSLLEIMVALAIIALAMTLVGVGFARSSAGFRFDAAAQDLMQTLREAQARALRTGREVAVVIDVDNHSYQLAQDTPVQLPADAGLRVVSAGQAMMESHHPAFAFMPDGGSTGGSVTLTAQGRTAVVAVDWLTGAVGMSKGDASAASQ
jgi:general secretion pathway protein H